MHHRPPNGTQKGDVFSFAIICQEIVYRSGVFHLANIDIGPQGIVFFSLIVYNSRNSLNHRQKKLK